MCKRLLSEETLTLKRPFEIVIAMEAANTNSKTFGDPELLRDLPELYTLSSGSCIDCGRAGHRESDYHFKVTLCHNCGRISGRRFGDSQYR